MYCEKCGKLNPDTAKFCSGCGAPLNAPAADAAANQPTPAFVPPQPDAPSAAKAKKKSPLRIIIPVVAAVLVVAAALFVVILTSRTSIDMNKYLTVETRGYDGYGEARAVIDWDAVENDYGKKLSFTSKAKNESGGLINLVSPVDYLKSAVKASVDKTSGLSNGDEIKVTWKVEEGIGEYVKCTVKTHEETKKISDLKEVGKFDPFEKLTVTFSGTSPDGYAVLEYSGDDSRYVGFQCDNLNNLKNGDRIKVSLDRTDASYYAENLGRVPEVFEKEFEVSGLPEYISETGKITDDFLSELKSDAEDSVLSYTAGDYSEKTTVSDLEYAGYIFCSAKEGTYYYDKNVIYVIYRGNVKNSDGKFRSTDVYYPVRFENILLQGQKGGLSYDSCEGVVGSTYLEDSYSYYTRGYANPYVLYKELAENAAENYDVEAGDGFEAYADFQPISSLSDFTVDFKNELFAEVENNIKLYVEKNYSEKSVAENYEIIGTYLLISKEQTDYFVNSNKYIVVYSAKVSNKDNKFKPLTVYFPVEYDGVAKLPDGEYLITKTVGIIGNSSIPDSSYSTKGYVDGKVMFQKIVTANRDNYSYEVSDGLKPFGE